MQVKFPGEMWKLYVKWEDYSYINVTTVEAVISDLLSITGGGCRQTSPTLRFSSLKMRGGTILRLSFGK